MATNPPNDAHERTQSLNNVADAIAEVTRKVEELIEERLPDIDAQLESTKEGQELLDHIRKQSQEMIIHPEHFHQDLIDHIKAAGEAKGERTLRIHLSYAKFLGKDAAGKSRWDTRADNTHPLEWQVFFLGGDALTPIAKTEPQQQDERQAQYIIVQNIPPKATHVILALGDPYMIVHEAGPNGERKATPSSAPIMLRNGESAEQVLVTDVRELPPEPLRLAIWDRIGTTPRPNQHQLHYIMRYFDEGHELSGTKEEETQEDDEFSIINVHVPQRAKEMELTIKGHKILKIGNKEYPDAKETARFTKDETKDLVKDHRLLTVVSLYVLIVPIVELSKAEAKSLKELKEILQKHEKYRDEHGHEIESLGWDYYPPEDVLAFQAITRKRPELRDPQLAQGPDAQQIAPYQRAAEFADLWALSLEHSPRGAEAKKKVHQLPPSHGLQVFRTIVDTLDIAGEI